LNRQEVVCIAEANNFIENLKEIDHFGDLRLGGTLVLEWTSEKQAVDSSGTG
jgi:hypothetical protein